MILRNLGWGVLPQEMFKENPELNNKLKALDVFDFTPRFEYYVDLVWSRESELGAAARFWLTIFVISECNRLPKIISI